MSNKANPVYFIHPLRDGRVLVACWIWYRRYLAEDLPDRVEIVSRERLAEVEAQIKQAGFRLIGPLETRREAVYRQILAAQAPPKLNPKQRAKYEARQARKREQAEAEAELQRRLGREQQSFREAFKGLGEAEVRRLYRSLARSHHPDAGGSEASFRLLEQAYREALRRL